MPHLRFRPPPSFWLNLDIPLMLTAIGLAVVGIFTLWGTAAVEGRIGPPGHEVRRQLLWMGLGVAAMATAIAFDYRATRRWSVLLYLLLMAALMGLLIQGRRIHGAASWYVLELGGFRFQGQPSEFGKIVVVLALAVYLERRALTLRRFHHTLAPLGLAALPAALIIRQPDLGTALVYFPPVFAMFWVAGLRKRVFALYAALALAGAALSYPHLAEYQKERIRSYLRLGEDFQGRDYNVVQARTALGSGQILGKGWGQGTQTSLRFLPEYRTDFILPAFGEQFGLIGCLALFLAYLALLARMVRLAARSVDLYGALLITGLATVLGVHLFLNVGMAMGLLPVAGLPLPFLSSGGSFMLTCFLIVGLTASVGVRRAG